MLDALVKGAEFEPIEIATAWYRSGAEGVQILDGHHRLMAYYLAKRKIIPASFSGSLALLAHLCGRS